MHIGLVVSVVDSVCRASGLQCVHGVQLRHGSARQCRKRSRGARRARVAWGESSELQGRGLRWHMEPAEAGAHHAVRAPGCAAPVDAAVDEARQDQKNTEDYRLDDSRHAKGVARVAALHAGRTQTVEQVYNSMHVRAVR